MAVASQMEGDSTVELSTNEAWYDAKEDLEPGVAMVPTGPADIPSASNDGKEAGTHWIGSHDVSDSERGGLRCVSCFIHRMRNFQGYFQYFCCGQSTQC